LLWCFFALLFNIIFLISIEHHPTSVYEWISNAQFSLSALTALLTILWLMLRKTTNKVVLLTSLNFLFLALGMPAFALSMYSNDPVTDPKSSALFLWTFIVWYGIFLGYVILLHVHYLLFWAGNIMFFLAMVLATFTIYNMDCNAEKLSTSHMLWSATLSILMTAKLVNSALKTNCLLFKNLQMVEVKKEQEMQQKMNSMKRQYIAQTLHDIGTPLTAMTLGQHIFDDWELPEELEEVIQTNQCALEMMVLTRKKALDFLKFEETGRLKPTLMPTDLRQILYQKCARIMTGYNSARKVQLKFHVDDCIAPKVVSDGDWIWEMLCNYLSNALKFTKKGSVEAAISLSDNKEYINFEVSDTGEGVKDEQKRLLFQPFSQLQDNAGGTGLGLYSVSCKVQALKGTAGVRDNRRAGKVIGALFYFTIPYVPCLEEDGYGVGIEEPMARTNGNSSDRLLPTPEHRRRSSHSSMEKMMLTTEDTGFDVKPLDAETATFQSFKHKRGNEVQNIEAPASNSPRFVPAKNMKKETKETQSALKYKLQDPNSDFVPAKGAVKFHHPHKVSFDEMASSSGDEKRGSSCRRRVWDDFWSVEGYEPNGQSLLLVEDEPSIAKFFIRMLTKIGFRVTHEDNGNSGLERMKAQEYHVVLCDITMPGLDGYETVRLFREWEQQNTPSLRRNKQVIIALSAIQMPDHKEKAMSCGFNSFLSKPVKILELLHEIKKETCKEQVTSKKQDSVK